MIVPWPAVAVHRKLRGRGAGGIEEANQFHLVGRISTRPVDHEVRTPVHQKWRKPPVTVSVGEPMVTCAWNGPTSLPPAAFSVYSAPHDRSVNSPGEDVLELPIDRE